MRRALATLALAAVLLVAGGAASTALPERAPAATAGACTTADGITMVVDFQELGGGTVVRCAPGPWGSSDDGFDVLERAGFAAVRVQSHPDALCRIDNKPAPTDEPCNDMVPASAYWSYWLSARGSDWCYSNRGGAARRAVPGTVEGWSFSKDHDKNDTPTPRVAPPQPLTGTPPPTIGRTSCVNEVPPTTTTTRAPVTTTTAAPTQPAVTTTTRAGGEPAPTNPAPAGASPTGPDASPTTTRDRSPAASGDGATTTTTTAGVTSGDDPAIPGDDELALVPGSGREAPADLGGAKPADDDDGGGPSPLGAIAGTGVIGGVAAAAIITARRRRSGPDLPDL